ncbi:MAG: 40S ribosomal protein S19, partial [Nanoarchaeota archaeon]
MKLQEADAQKFNINLALELKKMPEFEMPEWAYLVKTGTSRARPPFSSDYWHKRAGSILRQLAINGVVGVSRMRTKYGGRKDR